MGLCNCHHHACRRHRVSEHRPSCPWHPTLHTMPATQLPLVEPASGIDGAFPFSFLYGGGASHPLPVEHHALDATHVADVSKWISFDQHRSEERRVGKECRSRW